MFTEKSKWITFDNNLQSVNVYKSFTVSDVNCSIDICGLGFFELYLNGKKVSDDLFVPVWSNYCQRDMSTLLYPNNDQMTSRTYYLNYKLKEYVKEGENTLCVVLGNGWFRQKERNIEGKNHYGENLLLRFEITDKNNVICVSDEKCVYTENFIKFNNVYFGETHDYSVYKEEFLTPQTNVFNAEITAFNQTELSLQDCPPDRVKGSVGFEKVLQTESFSIYKTAKTMSGFVKLLSNGGDIKITFADSLKENGEFEYIYTGGDTQVMQDLFLNTKKGQILRPYFTWHAFTYFKIEGDALPLEAVSVYSNVEKNVEFFTDNKTLNWLFDAYVNTQTQNMHGGVPSDCPHRERLGYTGDGQITAETAMLIFDADKFYRKWIRDILDCQDIETGHVQHTAPFYGGGGGPGGWGCAIVIVPYEHYKRYDDISILKETYPYMKKWVSSMLSFCENDLVVKEYKDGWCLGEWCTPEPVEIPEPFVNTYYFIKALGIICEIGNILGERIIEYQTLKDKLLVAFKNNYYDEDSGRFINSIQGADAFGYSLGIGSEKTKTNIIERYSNRNSFDTGIFGTEILSGVLAHLNEYELLLKLLTSNEIGSFGFMKNNDATTLWEDWDGRNSRNHPMFGGAVKYLIYGFAGIKFDVNEIQPKIVKGINNLYCSVKGVKGKKSIKYFKENECIKFELYSEDETAFIYNGQRYNFSGNASFKFHI